MTLPESWVQVRLGEIADFVMGQAPPGSTCNFEGLGTPFVKAGEFGRERPLIREWTTRPLKMARREDVLICVVGATAGKLNLGADCAIGRSVAAIRPGPATTSEYLSPRLRLETSRLRGASTGTAQGVISRDMLAEIEIKLPPAAEQPRIVAKLDALTARIARARKELQRARPLADRLKAQAVRAAFRGELTAEWRTNGPAGTASGAPTAGLPPGWKWTALGELAQIKSGITLGKIRKADAELVHVPYLRVANVQRGALDLSVIKTVPVTAAEAEALYLQPGDILLNEGGDRDKLGRGWVWSGELANCIHQNHVFRARLTDKRNVPEYVSLYANEFGQDYFQLHGTQTTNLASISKAKLAALPIPLAPPEEQLEIVKRLQMTFARAGRLESEAERARALLDRLEAAILAKAFRGELVPQDPNDEPASVLLERIRAQRAETPKAGRGGKRAA